MTHTDEGEELNKTSKEKQEELEKANKEMKEELIQLKHEFKQLKHDLKDQRKQQKAILKSEPDSPSVKFSLNRSIENYVGSVMESVASSLENSMGNLFGPHRAARRGRAVLRSKLKPYSIASKHLPAFYKEGSSLLSIVADENRLKLLKSLEDGGKYQKELSELTDIKGGTFNHHMGKLMEMKLVAQEAVRGKYLITIEGREILKLAEFLFLQRHPEYLAKEESSEVESGDTSEQPHSITVEGEDEEAQNEGGEKK